MRVRRQKVHTYRYAGEDCHVAHAVADGRMGPATATSSGEDSGCDGKGAAEGGGQAKVGALELSVNDTANIIARSRMLKECCVLLRVDIRR